MRQAGLVRYPLNKVKYKHKYRDFYARYCSVYNSLAEKQRGCAMACQ